MHTAINKIYKQLFIDIKKGTKEEQDIFQDLITTFLYDSDILKLMNISHHKDTNRLMHCLHVSYRCFLTSYRHNMDYKSATIGGLLHDFCLSEKGDNVRETFRDIWCFYHPQVALKESIKRYELSETSKDMISKHMFPVALSFPKYKETYLIAYWDKHCAIQELLQTKKSIKNKI